jgi:uncharacterized protein
MTYSTLTRPLMLVAAFAICAFTLSPAHAAPPTEGQVDKLMAAMDMRHTLDEMLVQIDAMGENMTQQMLGEDATPEKRESLRKFMATQSASRRKLLSWDTLDPIYRKIYTRLFTAEEVEAMTTFYSSDAGRSVMKKMPQAMQLSMEEMQPLVQSMILDMRNSLETEIEHSGAGADDNRKAH